MSISHCVLVGGATGLTNSVLYRNFDGGQGDWNVIDSVLTGYGTAVGHNFGATDAGYFETAGNTVTYCCLHGNSVNIDADIEATTADVSTGVITTDPQIGPADSYVKNDYAVAAGSPCVGAGSAGGDIGFQARPSQAPDRDLTKPKERCRSPGVLTHGHALAVGSRILRRRRNRRAARRHDRPGGRRDCGSVVDQAIIGALTPARRVQGPRLTSVDITSSTEGAAITRLFGRTRLAGQMIWATRFEEVISKETTGGGKGFSGPKVTTTTYAYFANFAVALCEGPVTRIGRIWMDGRELDQTQVTVRSYLGTEDQSADSLIVAKEGARRSPGLSRRRIPGVRAAAAGGIRQPHAGGDGGSVPRRRQSSSRW
jgi:hypothetical protein